MRGLILCLITSTSIGITAPAQEMTYPEDEKRAEVLVLGVYHMANPGRDVVNMQADNVLSPKRQREIAELADVLKEFKPTKIAVEHGSQRGLNERYVQYLAGQYVLTADEIDQLGLRMAKDLGHSSICAVDADGDFPFPRLVKYTMATGQLDKFEVIQGGITEMVKKQGEYLKNHAVLQMLLLMNSDEQVMQDVGFYYLLGRFGEAGDYAGPDLLAEWYRRNVRIYCNIAKLVSTPEDRVLVIFGAGHLGWLRQAFTADPTMQLRRLDEFVRVGADGAKKP